MNPINSLDRRTLLGLISGGAVALSSGMALAQESGDMSAFQASLGDMMLGNPDAAVTVIEYASFTCPHCANFHRDVFPSLKENYIDTGKIHFIFRPVYFDGAGLWADMVARCGGGVRYFGMTSLLMERQHEWLGDRTQASIAQGLRAIGRQAGMSEEDVVACYSDEAAQETLIATFRENVTKDNISATPQFIINGELNQNMSYASFSALLDGLLGE